jgi:dihydrofolate reductase
MSKLVVIEHVTLDGVMQGPGRPDEDTRGDFPHGGWAAARTDDVMGQKMAGAMGGGGPLLLGRRTYEDFYGYWPNQTGNPFTPVLDAATKYVASTTLAEPLPWANSHLLDGGDAAHAVATLRRQDGPDIAVLGSGDLLRTLIGTGQVDELMLMIHPIVLGTGRRLFANGGPPAMLALTDCATTTTGVVIATYRPAS